MTTKNPHDSFAKNFFQELLSHAGTVDVERRIADEPRSIDIFFSPSFPPIVPADSIGLLARLTTQTAVIEVFRNQPTDVEMLISAGKLYAYVAELNREAKRKKTSLKHKDLGRLWIIATIVSQRLIDDYGATLDSDINCQGVYSFHKGWRGSIIAVNQLPVTDETLWLRILGKGTVQRHAVDELLALPDTNAYKANTLRMLANLRIVILEQPNSSENNQEDVMNLSTAYLEWEQKTLQQGELIGEQRGELIGEQRGEQRGELKGKQELIIRLLNRRVGEIQQPLIDKIRQLPVEQLELLGEAIFDFSTIADLEEWLQN